VKCPTCDGRHGWWVDAWGRRSPTGAGDYGYDGYNRWRECHDCIGGIASCCDDAGSAQPEPEDAP
jgi:hypothetical protein